MSVASELPALDPAAPGEVVAALEKALGDDLISVVLFGSRARNEADEASDWDVLIIARNLPERLLERYRLLKRISCLLHGVVEHRYWQRLRLSSKRHCLPSTLILRLTVAFCTIRRDICRRGCRRCSG